MIKLVVFDLDGVLVKTKEIHWQALNKALEQIDPKYIISYQEHVAMYDGLKTDKKLRMLTEHKQLPPEVYDQVWLSKQQFTKELCEQQLKPNPAQIELFEMLDNEQYIIACCSNAIRDTTVNILRLIGLANYFDIILSNEDVMHAKPYPEMYWKAMAFCECLPYETIIFEDSPPGLQAAEASGAVVARVESPADVTINFIFDKISKSDRQLQPKWSSDKVNVLIPMAGAGTRFERAGYTFPKPLIEVHGKPMIQLVVENLGMDANHIFIVQKKHRDQYNLDVMMNLIRPKCQIVEVDGITEGAACTTLLAAEYIDNNNPLIIANSDQLIEWNPTEFMYYMQEHDFDGAILTFKSAHPKWSFAKCDDDGLVTEVAEKNPISDNATAGVYYWKRGSDYVKYARQMIEKNLRVNNEFYVCPVFNEAIADGKRIKSYPISRMWGLGTPEDLNTFLMLGPK
jgi:HAD superfamily hydrolase (TIGR01509 family)